MPVLERDEFERWLEEIVQRLRAAFSPVAIYLFGSYEYGTPAAHSDIDLLVIVRNDEAEPFSRDAKAYRCLHNIPVPVDVQVYTQAEFEDRAKLPVSFERTVKSRGRVVYAA